MSCGYLRAVERKLGCLVMVDPNGWRFSLAQSVKEGGSARITLRKYSDLEEQKLPRGWTLEECAVVGSESREWYAVHRQFGVRGPTTSKVKAMLAAWAVHNEKVLPNY